MTDIRTEVAGSYAGIEVTWTHLALPVRAKVLAFAVEHGIDEHEAIAVIAARYFRMVEDDRWATWLASGEEEG